MKDKEEEVVEGGGKNFDDSGISFRAVDCTKKK